MPEHGIQIPVPDALSKLGAAREYDRRTDDLAVLKHLFRYLVARGSKVDKTNDLVPMHVVGVFENLGALSAGRSVEHGPECFP